jgi:hypothetical protein
MTFLGSQPKRTEANSPPLKILAPRGVSRAGTLSPGASGARPKNKPRYLGKARESAQPSRIRGKRLRRGPGPPPLKFRRLGPGGRCRSLARQRGKQARPLGPKRPCGRGAARLGGQNTARHEKSLGPARNCSNPAQSAGARAPAGLKRPKKAPPPRLQPARARECRGQTDQGAWRGPRPGRKKAA